MQNLIEAITLVNKGKWDKAHKIVQGENSIFSNWIHANLHRQEGDIGNALFWYSRCKKEMPKSNISFEAEREIILNKILEQ